MNKEELNPFLADVLALKLRFPVAEIARRTGEDKANVSAYVKGRKQPTRTFQVLFYTSFRKEFAEIGIHRDLIKMIGIKSVSPASSPSVRRDNELCLDLLFRLLTLSTEMNERIIRIDRKVDDLLKYSKYGGQVWDKN
jgi:hypothetical protein